MFGRAGPSRRERGWSSAGLGWGLGLLLTLSPTLARACPACTARAPESPGLALGWMAAMILVPVLLVAAGVWAARRAAHLDMEKDP